MIPAVGLILLGKTRWSVPLPLPVFLAWPLVLVALGGVTVAEHLVARRHAVPRLTLARAGLLALCQLSGLKIDVRSADGTRVLIWLM